jgi:hypothetical protein
MGYFMEMLLRHFLIQKYNYFADGPDLMKYILSGDSRLGTRDDLKVLVHMARGHPGEYICSFVDLGPDRSKRVVVEELLNYIKIKKYIFNLNIL